MVVHTAAAFDDPRNVEVAVTRLLENHVTPKAMSLVHEPAGESLAIRRPIRVFRDGLVGVIGGGVVGLGASVLLGITAPGLLLAWESGDLVSVAAVVGGLVGAFGSLIMGQIRVELPDEPLAEEDQLILGVEVDESRLPEVQTILAESGGVVAGSPSNT